MDLIQHGKNAEAVFLLERAAASEPKQARVRSALGVAYASQGMYDLAEPQFHKACALDSKLGEACYYEARALYAMDRFEQSIAVLRHIPESWQVDLAIAQAQEGLGNGVEAEGNFRKSRALARNSVAQPDVAMGLFLLRQGRASDAITLLEDTVRRFPSDVEARIHLGHALLEQDKFAQAIPYLEGAVKAQPASAQAHLLLGKAYLRSGRSADAQPHFAAAEK